jgi:hypothetical protein
VTGGGALLVAGNPLLAARTANPLGHRHHPLGPLRIRGFAPLVACSGALGVTFGAIAVAVAAFADQGSHGSATAGVLLALWGVGSVIGGGVFARRPPPLALTNTLAVLLVLIAISTWLLAAVPGPATLGVVLALGGLAVAPSVAAYTTLANAFVPAHLRGEANAWLVTMPAAAQAMVAGSPDS